MTYNESMRELREAISDLWETVVRVTHLVRFVTFVNVKLQRYQERRRNPLRSYKANIKRLRPVKVVPDKDEPDVTEREYKFNSGLIAFAKSFARRPAHLEPGALMSPGKPIRQPLIPREPWDTLAEDAPQDVADAKKALVGASSPPEYKCSACGAFYYEREGHTCRKA